MNENIINSLHDFVEAKVKLLIAEEHKLVEIAADDLTALKIKATAAESKLINFFGSLFTRHPAAVTSATAQIGTAASPPSPVDRSSTEASPQAPTPSAGSTSATT